MNGCVTMTRFDVPVRIDFSLPVFHSKRLYQRSVGNRMSEENAQNDCTRMTPSIRWDQIASTWVVYPLIVDQRPS